MARPATWALALAFVCCVPTAQAELSPERRQAAEGLLRQFSAVEFETRQKAVDALVAMGPDVVPLVKKALAETADNEVKLRCEMTLKGLREKFGAAAVDGEKATTPATNYDASKVTLDVKDAPLAEVLQSLADQSGNAPLKAAKFADRKVTLSVKDVPYWQAFDTTCESAGVVYQSAPWRGATPMLVDAKVKAPGVSGYAGPVVLWVDRIYRTSSESRTLSTRTDTTGMVMTPVQRSINVQARMSIEGRLAPSGCTVRLTAARTPDGKNVLPNPPFNMPVPAKGARRISYTNWSPTLSVPDSPEGIQGPLTLEGKVQVEYFHGTRRVQVDDVLAGGRPSATTTCGSRTSRSISAPATPGSPSRSRRTRPTRDSSITTCRRATASRSSTPRASRRAPSAAGAALARPSASTSATSPTSPGSGRSSSSIPRRSR